MFRAVVRVPVTRISRMFQSTFFFFFEIFLFFCFFLKFFFPVSSASPHSPLPLGPPTPISGRNFSSALTVKETPPTSNVPANYEPPQPKIETPKPTPKIQKVVSVWRTRTLWFAIGATTSGVIGYMKLIDEVRQANTDLKTRLLGAHNDVTLLHNRIKDMELRLAQVEEHKTLDPPKKDLKIFNV
jgi:hypothetical protein